MRLALILSLLLASPAIGQGVVVVQGGGTGLDATAVDNKIAAATASLATTTALTTGLASKCDPTAMVPPMEAVGGAAGSGSGCRLANSVQPRISRSQNVVTDASCNWSAPWTNPLSGAPTISLSWVNTTPAAGAIKCEMTADPTTTTTVGRCLREQPQTTLAAVTVVGISVAVGSQVVNINQAATTSCAGIKVHVVALPPAL